MPSNKRQTWYDGIPRSENPWDHFSADRLEANEIRNGDQILAKIPKIPGMISRRTKKDGDYITTYIELILSHTYDKDKKQSRNRRVIIGTDISHIFPGMMVINSKYHDYFDTKGNLLAKSREDNLKDKDPQNKNQEDNTPQDITSKDNNPKGERQAEKAEPAEQPKERPEEQTQQQLQTNQQSPIQPNRQTEPQEEENEDDWDEDEEDSEEDKELARMLQESQRKRDRVEHLNSLLIEYKTTIDEQAKRRPDKPLTLYQIRRINELLAEVKDLLSEYDTGAFLQLAEEPVEDNTNSTNKKDNTNKTNNTNTQPITYADMAILLSNYYCTMFSYRTHRLWLKPRKEE